MSTLRVNTLQNTSGVEVYTAKAWVNFNGTGTVAIRAAGNVSSITDNGVGDYTANFTTAMVDANYGYALSCSNFAGGLSVIQQNVTTAPTTSAIRIRTADNNGNAADNANCNISIFR